jgi:hypothetical protein
MVAPLENDNSLRTPHREAHQRFLADLLGARCFADPDLSFAVLVFFPDRMGRAPFFIGTRADCSSAICRDNNSRVTCSFRSAPVSSRRRKFKSSIARSRSRRRESSSCSSSCRAVRISLRSPGTGESGARARLAFRTLRQSAVDPVATSCRKCHYSVLSVLYFFVCVVDLAIPRGRTRSSTRSRHEISSPL